MNVTENNLPEFQRKVSNGICCKCKLSYRHGYQILSEIEPGVVEPENLCQSCYKEVNVQ